MEVELTTTFIQGTGNAQAQPRVEDQNASSLSPLDQILQLGKADPTSSEDEAAEPQLEAEQEYKACMKQKEGGDVIRWWRKNKLQYPGLYQLAKNLLIVPASSAPSERAFSSAGRTVTKLTNRLTGDHVDAITFLHMNEDVL